MLRRVAILILLTAGLSLGGVAAWAYWGALVNPGGGGGLAATVNAATTPTAGRTSATSVALSWPAVTLDNGVAVDGYVVKRYDATTLLTQTVLGGCAGTVGATTCTETSVPVGTWRYSVYPRIGANWTGTESALTAGVSVINPVLTLAKTVYNAPASTSGTLTGFGVNETVTYRLDASTALTGFPGVVDTTGAAPISSLAIPATTQGTHTVYALGGNGSTATATITYDSVAPTVSAVLSPLATGGWNTTSPVQVTLSASDATTSVASIRYTVDGSDPTSSGTAVTYSGPFTVAATSNVRYYATDTAGNSSAVASQPVQIDTLAPGSSIALGSVSGARLSGSTVWYRGTAGGSFTIVNTVTDAGSGPASSSTSALTGTTAGWSHVPSAVTSGPPYTSNAFTWTGAAAGTVAETVTSADVAGNTSSTVLSFVNDSTGPAGGGVSVSSPAYSTSTTLALTTSKGTDAGVGLATSGALLQRASATLTTGSCGTFGSFATIQTDPAASLNDVVADQACYRYQFVVADLLGNTTTHTSADVKVDTTAPATPTLSYSSLVNAYATGSTVYYRGSATGSFTVTAASTDTASGIASYTFPSLGTGWSSSAGALGINTYSWTASPAAPGAKQVTATNGAGLSTNSASFTPTDDSTAPSGGSLTYNAGWTSSNSVTLTLAAGSDAGSGLATTATLLQRRSAALLLGVCDTTYSAWTTIATGVLTSPRTDTTVTGDNCYQYQLVTYDNVGNTTAYPANSNPVVKVPMYYTCQEAAIGGTALGYYKLAEASGTVAADSSGNGKTGQYANVSAYNAGGPCGGGGVTYNGILMGYVSTPLAATNPVTYSEELWFKTSSGNSMRLMGFGDQQTGNSATYDRTLYLDTNSKLVYGYNAGVLSYKTVTTSAAYNDNKWHHVVATQSPVNGMRLYVDGAIRDSDPTAKTPQNYAGFWRIGSDNMGGWPSLTILINSYTNGSLAHAAVYGRELAGQEVFNHYLAAQLTSPGVLTAPASIAASVASSSSTARRPAAPSLPAPPPPATTPPATTPTTTPPATAVPSRATSTPPAASSPSSSSSTSSPAGPAPSASMLTGVPSFSEEPSESPGPAAPAPLSAVLPSCPSSPRSCSAEATPSG